MAITYNVGTNIITITGYTEGTPCNFTDIYNADVGGGWGKVTRQCTDQFCFNCKLQVGDGSTTTWFADEKKEVKWASTITTANYQSVILVKTNGNCRFGKLIDDSKKITRNGCCHLYAVNAFRTFFIWCETGAALQLHASCLVSSNYTPYTLLIGFDGSTKIYNTNFNGMGIHKFSNISMYNVLIEYAEYGVYSVLGTVDKATINNTYVFGIIFYNTLATLKNTRHQAKLGGSTIRAGNVVGNCYLINPELESWDISWGGTGYPVIYRQYEFDLKVIDKDNTVINNATVKIWDKESTLIVNTTTDACGVIATQRITRGYYNQANGNTLQEKSPHTIEIKKSGTNYLTYKTNFVLDDKTNWVIMMTDVSDIVDGINDLKGTGFVKDTDSMVNTADTIWDQVKRLFPFSI